MNKFDKSKQKVFNEVLDIMKNSYPIKLPEVQTILFKKYFLKEYASDFLNEKIVIEAYKKAVSKMVNVNDGQ